MSKCEASHIDQIVLGLYLNLAFSTTKYLDLLLSGKFLPCYFLASIQHLLPTFWALLFLYILFYFMYKFIKRLSQYSLIRVQRIPWKRKVLREEAGVVEPTDKIWAWVIAAKSFDRREPDKAWSTREFRVHWGRSEVAEIGHLIRSLRYYGA